MAGVGRGGLFPFSPRCSFSPQRPHALYSRSLAAMRRRLSGAWETADGETAASKSPGLPRLAQPKKERLAREINDGPRATLPALRGIM